MTDAENLARLVSVLDGTGARVNAAYQVCALDTDVTDEHIEHMADWADLEHLMLSGSLVTDRCLPAIATFDRLVSLDIGGTAITSPGLANATLPQSLRDVGVYDVQLDDSAVGSIASLPNLRMLNCNGCNLSFDALLQLLVVPTVRAVEALGADIPDAYAEDFTLARPGLLLRLDSGVWKNGNVRRPPGYKA